jgi:hypothetical protein
VDSLVELHARRLLDGMQKSGLPRSGAVGDSMAPCGEAPTLQIGGRLVALGPDCHSELGVLLGHAAVLP